MEIKKFRIKYFVFKRRGAHSKLLEVSEADIDNIKAHIHRPH